MFFFPFSNDNPFVSFICQNTNTCYYHNTFYSSVFKANTTLNDIYYHSLKYVSESDILGPSCNLSDIKNLVSFEREMFENSSYSYRIKKSFYLCHYHHFEIHA